MTFRQLQFTVLVLLFAIFYNARPAQAANACFQCHDKNMFQQKNIHQPLSKGECIACHNPHVANHKGLLQKDLKSLCLSCHEKSFKTKGVKAVLHEPVRQGKCVACHNPHSSNYKALLNGKLTKSCAECHEGLKSSFKITHKPYAEGRCNACHSLHWAENFQLLVSTPEKLCKSCHSDSEINGAHKNYPAKINGCLSCHSPHGSDNRAMIRNVLHKPFSTGCKDCHDGSGSQASQETCLKCHKEVTEDLLTTHNHLTAVDGNGCVNCHSPHAGDTKSLLKDRQIVLCRNCHNDTYKRHEDDLFIHKATANDCKQCHDIHGSNQVALIKGDANKVCLACHPDQGQFSHPVGQDVPDPRNKQMTTCVSCHNPHGSNFRGDLKLSGQEDLCIQCHKM